MSHVVRAWFVLAAGWLLVAPATVEARETIHTTATYYHPSLHGRPMANGQPYDRWNPQIAACNWFPLGTLLKVTRLDTDAFIYVRVQDRGSRALTLDLSEAGFQALGRPQEGRIPVRVELIHATDDAQEGLSPLLLREREAADLLALGRASADADGSAGSAASETRTPAATADDAPTGAEVAPVGH